jgi:hypothetical protein
MSELCEIAAMRLIPEQRLGFMEQVVDCVIPEADGRLLVRRRSSPTSFVLSYLAANAIERSNQRPCMELDPPLVRPLKYRNHSLLSP